MIDMILLFILLMSISAFCLMGYDKAQAKKNGQRIPERTLWTFAIFGGGIGAYLGMRVFHHKTKHTNFRVGFLMLLLMYMFLIFWLLSDNGVMVF